MGSYFLEALFADIDSLAIHGGIHRRTWGAHRLLPLRGKAEIDAKKELTDEEKKRADDKKLKTVSMKTELVFIERCLDLLSPGGRMGVVLPEGIFNNPSLSYPIHQTMYHEISISDIFVADLTGLRPNVMIELGYALRDHQPKGRMLLIFNSIPAADKMPFDTTTFRYEPISEAADIPNALRKHFNAIVEDAKAGKI